MDVATDHLLSSFADDRLPTANMSIEKTTAIVCDAVMGRCHNFGTSVKRFSDRKGVGRESWIPKRAVVVRLGNVYGGELIEDVVDR